MSLSKSDQEFVKRVGEWRVLDDALLSKQRRINELEAALIETYEQVYDNPHIDALVDRVLADQGGT